MKTIASITSENRTEGQEKQFKRLLEDGVPKALVLALKKLNPDKDGMDRLLGNGDEVINAMVDAVLEKAREFTTPDQYADEEVESSYAYPEEYKGPRPIAEQIRTLANIFGLDPSHALEFAEKVLPTLTLPEGTEGWFAILSPTALEKLFPQAIDLGDRYCQAVSLVLGKIAASRKFYNYREGQITKDRLRQHSRTVAAIGKIAESQKGDILVVPAQLGLCHRGRSVRRARVCLISGEFGLRALDVGCIALTHPERLVRFEELDMDCSGDEFDDPDSVVRFGRAPYLCFHDDWVKFGTFRVGNARVYFGSASGFLPQLN
jgi:hypothetical protein